MTVGAGFGEAQEESDLDHTEHQGENDPGQGDGQPHLIVKQGLPIAVATVYGRYRVGLELEGRAKLRSTIPSSKRTVGSPGTAASAC